MHNRTQRIILLAFMMMASSASIFAQVIFSNKNDDMNVMRKLLYATSAVKELYVDSVNENKLVEDAIRGMLKELDPHSIYSTAKETKALTEPLQGSFEGIGVQFNMAQDTLLIIQTISGGPSEKAGLLAGDRIVAVNDTAIAGVKMERNEIMRRLRGPKGTKVELQIVRRGIKGALKFTVKRDKIPLTTIDASYMIAPKTGYVRISSFGATTYDEFVTATDSLKRNGMEQLIIDLQENGGGLLQAAVMIANELLDRNDLIVYTEGRTQPRHDFHADGRGRLKDIKVAVLINEYSASASEILSGAIQDHDRGIIVGRRSFGKGLVQRPIDFPDGSMIRITTAHYYTPTGRCIQKPYEKGDKEQYEQDIEKRFKHGELYCKDSIQFADSLKYYTIKKKKVVYGGGGIMPDNFVPLDTTQYSLLHRKLSAKSCIINGVLKYVDNNRKSLKKQYKTFDAFDKNFNVPQSLIDAILADGEKNDAKPKDDDELKNTLPMLTTQVKALIARDIWSMTEYFQVMNRENHVVQEALRAINE